jgi:hypothetical protein
MKFNFIPFFYFPIWESLINFFFRIWYMHSQFLYLVYKAPKDLLSSDSQNY